MGRGVSDETKKNRYYQARMKAAAEFDSLLVNREYAAERISAVAHMIATKNMIDDIENDRVKTMSRDVCFGMCIVYKDNLLANHFCTTENNCPLGLLVCQRLDNMPMHQPISTLKCCVDGYNKALDTVGKIFADGKVDEWEEKDLDEADRELGMQEKMLQQLRTCVKDAKDRIHQRRAESQVCEIIGR